MKIRGKIVVVVLPLIFTPILFAGLISSLLARNGITGVAAQFLQFKGEQISSYATGQWQLLVENDLTTSPEFVEAAVSAIESFSRNVIRTSGELIFAVDSEGNVDFAAGATPDGGILKPDIQELIQTGNVGWQRLTVAGTDRVAHALKFEPLDWMVYVTEEEAAFYEAPNSIIRQLGIVLAVSLTVAVVLLMLFAAYLTNPLRQIVKAMTNIIRTNDLSSRVEVLYPDETGQLGHTFNLMVSQLEGAYGSIKREALRAAIAQHQEQKTRNIFQKYVPADVIKEIFANPEKMLVGRSEVLAILFSDIRSFTTISEGMRPDEVVESLNQYFTIMVDVITDRGGMIDKYMGDAIMALFGAPVRHDDDAHQAVLASLDMLDSLNDFNIWQQKRDRPPFKIGIGINYGTVTIGNIGSEKKMDYTVIGDMVNLASRLEGLTKRYDQPLIVSESVIYKVGDKLPHRLM
ncbi:MAG: HAMP domain-containing protein, partial [Spirochaetaceae bacterium]|nr:HAMP domain-containing protein [Spirochaetaceae bacterium]